MFFNDASWVLGGESMTRSRREILGLMGFTAAAGVARPAFATQRFSQVAQSLMARALAALSQHAQQIPFHDLIGIADFSQPSRVPRFHLLDLTSGRLSSHLVAHGFGSDPTHTGWLQKFSNEPSSKASSAGAFRTDELYSGKHGRSIRLSGLDMTNSNAQARAIVVHHAPYVNSDIIRTTGVLGRSDGCFAVSADSIAEVLAKLAPGRMIYADNIG